jgi:hypothetical protein
MRIAERGCGSRKSRSDRVGEENGDSESPHAAPVAAVSHRGEWQKRHTRSLMAAKSGLLPGPRRTTSRLRRRVEVEAMDGR